MRLKLWHGLVLTSLLTLLVYYPSFHAGYNSVDDLKMINGIENAGPFDLQKHFFPDSKRYYYRPLNSLTFYFDRDVWGTLPSFMHLENILLHLGCALLVYAITRRLTRLFDHSEEIIPLFAALFFALHPLTAESVCWISGRTDPLSGLFMLLAVWLTLIGLQSRNFPAPIGAGLALHLACLAKEVAVFILPGLLWMVVVYPEQGLSFLGRLKRHWLALTAPVLATVGYFVIRHLAIARDTGVSTALKGITASDYDLLNKIRVALKVYGFYFKKLFIPWPLNFGIIEVSGWYVLAGLLLAGVLFWLALRRRLLEAFGLMAFCVLAPAVLVPFGKMAWTPLAERYLYTPVALFAPMASIYLFRGLARLNPLLQRRGSQALMVLLLVFFASTLHRAWIWQDNERLYRDTVAKSPNLPAAKAELASALQRKGKMEESEAILVAMQTDNPKSGYLVDDFNLAQRYAARGEYAQARDLLIIHLDKKHKKYHDLLLALIKINDARLGTVTEQEQLEIQRESLDWLLEAQRVRPNAFTRYRIGKYQLQLGDEEAALESFRAAMEKAPADAHYLQAAKTFIKKLEGT